jgi:trans-aconitate 2-methyltransferase
VTRPNAPASDRREWNAVSYHRVANPHVDWGRAVLDRLPLRGDETVIDAGCGTGRLTALVLERLPHGHVIAIDQSANMLETARTHLDDRFPGQVIYLQRDLLDLDLEEAADVVFSTATFHWVRNHPALFARLFRALRPGGLLVAQCGGGPNIAAVAARALALLRRPPFAAATSAWDGPWTFAGAEETVDRLRAAGFHHAEAEVIHAPVVLDGAAAYREFLATVVLGTHLERLPNPALREPFLDEMVRLGATDDPPWLLDYWRLNLQGQRPA